ncbi:hypothetical protein ACH347_29780 [Saccharopolyspora sp. 5N102]|uniref:hypothetical protein n=1 Tax=Saccharopolyspora sp. 5N102 TaxID=3375155 RepID=UPI00379B5292
MEFDVLCFTDEFTGRRDDERFGPQPDTVAVSLPPREVAGMQRALESRTAGLRWSNAELAASLIDRMNTAESVTVRIPIDELRRLKDLLSDLSYWSAESDDSVASLDNLRHHLDLARPVAGPWPRVRDILQDALGEALSRPGAEGLAARDELLDIVRRFADTHRTATAADDEEQRRLQAEQPEPEDQPSPPSIHHDPSA